jgi:hypothetical protein
VTELKNAGYYEAMAQALPVLFIVLLVEYRGTRASWEPLRQSLPGGETLTPLLALAVGLLIGLGEFASLHVLAEQKETTFDSILISGAISLAALGLLVPITISLANEVPGRGATWPQRRASRRRTARIIYLAVGAIWLAAIAYFLPI